MNFLYIQKPCRSKDEPYLDFFSFRCQIFLKGQQVSEHTGFGKNKTRNFAAADILFHLYEKNDVVRVSVEFVTLLRSLWLSGLKIAYFQGFFPVFWEHDPYP